MVRKSKRDELTQLRQQVEELKQTLDAIQHGEVDALVVSGDTGEQVYSLKSAEHPYRVMIEQMSDGALALSADGIILYCNESFSRMVKYSPEEIVSTPIIQYLESANRNHFQRLLQYGGRGEISLQTKDNKTVPVYAALSILQEGETSHYFLIITDLSEHVHMDRILASERFARVLLERAADAVLICDTSGIIIRASEKAFHLFQRQLIGKSLDNIFHQLHTVANNEAITFHIIREAIVPSGLEVVEAIDNKSTHNFLLNFNQITEGDSILGYSISLTGITERKKAEQALKESEEKYRNLFNNMTESFVLLQPVVDLNGEPYDYRILEANKSAAELAGLTEEKIKGKTFLEIDPNFETHWKENFGKVALTGESVHIEQYNRYLNKWFDVYAYMPRKGTIAAVTTDITQRKQAEEAQKESEDRYRTFFENSLDAVLLTSPDGSILAANAAACQMFGMTEEEIIKSGRNGIVDTSDPRLIPALEERARTGRFKGELNYKRKDGTIFPGEVSTAIFTDRNGQSRTAMIIRDISERKKLEEKILENNMELAIKVKERTLELQETNRQLKEYANKITEVQEEERKRIAYELHDDTAQYLAILKLQLDSILHSGKIQDPGILEKLEYLEKDAGRAVDDVRRYSHELRPGVLDHLGLQAALEQIAEDTNKLKQIAVEVIAEGDEPAMSDEVKLGIFRIAQEALSNARKHAHAQKAVINLKYQDDLIIMSVSDDGIGFDVKEAETRSSLKGSLGLMSMQERAKLIGADLKIESASGQGTIVEVEMPL